jgi:hypothetical protein
MHRCPFHSDSSGVSERGEIQRISCPTCGDYRISETALERLEGATSTPSDWSSLVGQRPLISTRDLHR